MFADDTNLFSTGNSIDAVEQQLNTELVLINTWFQVNLLSLNVTKMSFIIFGRKNNLTANIYINNVLIQRQHDTKFLGVILSADLKWDKNIDIVTIKVSKNIGIIAKARPLLPQHLTRTLYLTLVDPYVSYCNLVWSLSHAATKLDRIYKLPKKNCRLITFSNFTAPSRPLFQHLSMLSVYDKYKYQLLIQVYKSSHNLIPNHYSCQYYIKNSSIYQHNTRQQNNLHIPKCRSRTCIRQNTIIYQGPKLWNALPDGMKSSNSFNIFKKQLRHYILLWHLFCSLLLLSL